MPDVKPLGTPRGRLLSRAKDLTEGDRARQYGPPRENHERIARLAYDVTGHSLTATDIALILCCVKLSRIAEDRNHADSYADLAAYVAIAYECQEVPEEHPD